MSLTPETMLYTETRNGQPFNWFKILMHKLETNAEPTLSLGDKASSWITCACGNMCAIIPRNENGSPKDNHLRQKGMIFFDQVRRGEWQSAIDTLHAIETRSAEIMEEIALDATTGRKK